jgi:hypothetical protein
MGRESFHLMQVGINVRFCEGAGSEASRITRYGIHCGVEVTRWFHLRLSCSPALSVAWAAGEKS